MHESYVNAGPMDVELTIALLTAFLMSLKTAYKIEYNFKDAYFAYKMKDSRKF